MADDNNRVGVEAYLDLDDWNTSVKDLLDDADKVDAALEGIQSSLRDISTDVDVGITLDLQNESVIGELEEIGDTTYEPSIAPDLVDRQALDEVRDTGDATYEPSIDPSITDDTELAELRNLDNQRITVDVTADIADETAINELNSLDTSTLTPNIDPTISDEQPVTEITGLDTATVTPTIDPQQTDDGKSVVSGINALAALQAIQIGITVVGNALEFINDFKDFLLTPITDLDSGMAKFGAQTGVAGEELQVVGDTIKQLHEDDLGENIGQITDVAIAAKQAGLDIDEAARAALTFTHTFTDQDPIAVMDTLNQMVSQGLAPNLATAGDLLTVAFQNGANKGNDLLATINDNAVAFHDMGLNGEQALSAVNSLIAGGIPTAGEAARALTDLDKSLGAAAENPTSDANRLLRRLGIDNPKEDGEAIGADYLQGLIDAIQKAPPDLQEQATTALFGKAGTKSTSALLNLDVADDSFSNVTGASEKAAAQADDSLQGAVDDFKLTLETIAQNFLSSDQIDLPGKLKAIKQGLQEASDVLLNGGTFESAIQVTLQSIGLDDDFERIEGTIGDFVIGVEQAVASVLETLGHSKEAAGIRAQVAEQGQTQLAFNLQIANPDEVDDQISTAVSRGVTAEGITQAVGTAVSELVASGATEQAQAIVDEVNKGGSIHFEVSDAIKRAQIEAQGMDAAFDVPITPEMSPEDIQKLIDDTQTYFQGFPLSTNIVPSVSAEDIDALQKQIDDAELKTNGFHAFDTAGGTNPTPTSGAFEPAPTSGFHGFGTVDPASIKAPEVTEAATEVQTQLVNTAQAAADYQTAMYNAGLTSSTDFNNSMIAILSSGGDMADGLEAQTGRVNTAITGMGDNTTEVISGNTMTEDFEVLAASAEENLAIVTDWANIAFGALYHFGDLTEILHSVTENLSAMATAATQANTTTQAAASNGALVGSGPSSFAGQDGGSGASSVSNVNRTQSVVVNQTIYTQSAAQSANVAQTTATAVRGF